MPSFSTHTVVGITIEYASITRLPALQKINRRKHALRAFHFLNDLETFLVEEAQKERNHTIWKSCCFFFEPTSEFRRVVFKWYNENAACAQVSKSYIRQLQYQGWSTYTHTQSCSVVTYKDEANTFYNTSSSKQNAIYPHLCMNTNNKYTHKNTLYLLKLMHIVYIKEKNPLF